MPQAGTLPQLDMSTSVPLSTPAPSALPKLDMSTSVPLDSAAPASLPTTTGGSVGSGVWDAVKGAAEGATTAAGETIQSLPYVGKHIISPESMAAERAAFAPGSIAEKGGQYAGKIAEPILEFVLGDEALKSVALADKIGLAGQISKIAVDHPYIAKLLQHGVLAARMGTVGGVQALSRGATLPQALKTGAAVGAGGSALSAATDAAPALLNPFRMMAKGAEVAQEPAATAVREAAGAAAGTPILEGATTAVDSPISDLGAKKAAAYKQIDNEVGFDWKAENDKLADLQYAIKQPGADVAALQKDIDTSMQAIADARPKLAAKGINPKVADQLNTSWEAGRAYKKAIVSATKADGTINIDSLVNKSKALRFSKYGDRLAQFFGKGNINAGQAAADEYMAALQDAQKMGAHAMKVQDFAKQFGKYAGYAAASAVGASGAYGVGKATGIIP